MQYLSHNYNGVETPLESHLLSVADRCGSGLYYNIGLMHDFGKYRENFQRYLRGEDIPKQKKTHAVAGALMLHKLFHDKVDPTTLLIGMIAIASHHTGLQDDVSSRLISETSKCEFIESDHVGSQPILSNLQPITPINHGNLAMQIRFALSYLVDADWTDVSSKYGNYVKIDYADIPALRNKLDAHLRNIPKNNLSTIRDSILGECIGAASNVPGWYSLNVPTGGGKTLSGMAFALHHAIHNGKQRVIVVIPYTSIIDQTHQVYADIFGDENVLAHHSNIEPIKNYRQQSQTWEPPIVITTMVQFLETLQACKTKTLRKLKNVANSVIIIDESQNIPLHLMDVTMNALKSLVEDFGCTIVTSTATQVELCRWGVTQTQIISNHGKLHLAMKRTNIQYDHAIDVVDAISNGGSSLTIVNTRNTALTMHRQVSSKIADCYCLTTLMYPAHRKKMLADIKARLNNKETVRIISTQLIEAGVDIDLPIVYREIAGVDNIVQAAGRCNRNGNQEIGNVIVFGSTTQHIPFAIRQGINCTYKTMDIIDINAPSAPTVYATLMANDADTDLYKIIELHDPRPHKIQFAEIARRYKIVSDSAYNVICSTDVDASNIKEVQQYMVSVYGKDIENMLSQNIIVASDDYEDTYQITDNKWYSSTTGLHLPPHDPQR